MLSSRITVELQPQSRPVMHGDTVRFTCTVRHAVPSPVIQWQEAGTSTMLQSNDRITILPNGVLQIRNVRLNVDAGSYQCIVTNPASKRHHTSTPAQLVIIPGKGYSMVDKVLKALEFQKKS